MQLRLEVYGYRLSSELGSVMEYMSGQCKVHMKFCVSEPEVLKIYQFLCSTN